MRCDLVARGVDVPDEPRMLPRDPADGEEGGVGVVPGQQVEQDVHVPLDAGLEPVPLGPGDEALERGDMEVLLHVNGEEVRRGLL